jgi:hypothetical protein
MFCLLYSPKQVYINTKSHVIDILASEDMENMSLRIFQYLALYYIINIDICHFWEHILISAWQQPCRNLFADLWQLYKVCWYWWYMNLHAAAHKYF